MGVEPFLLASSLIGVLAQRLVRVLDDTKKIPYTASEYECNLLGVNPANPPTLYHPGEGTNGGFTGRTGIYELISVDDEMRAMIHNGVSEQDLERHARKTSQGIRADGRRRVLAGDTTVEELLRVTRED
jgi:general secretion pathway protein E